MQLKIREWNIFGFHIWRSLKASMILHCAWSLELSWQLMVYGILIILELPASELCPVLRFTTCSPFACDGSFCGSSLDECFDHQFCLCATIQHRYHWTVEWRTGDWPVFTAPSVVKSNIPKESNFLWLCSHWPAQWLPFSRKWTLENFSATRKWKSFEGCFHIQGTFSKLHSLTCQSMKHDLIFSPTSGKVHNASFVHLLQPMSTI